MADSFCQEADNRLPEGKPERRSESGARGRNCTPFPGGSGAPRAGTMTGPRGARWTGTGARRAKHPREPSPRKQGSGAEPSG